MEESLARSSGQISGVATPPAPGHGREPLSSEGSVPAEVPVILAEVSVPEYTVDREPDFRSLGGKVDRAIEVNFPDGKYVLRAVSLDEHPTLTIAELTRMILTVGTDKYDPQRRSVGQDEFSGYDYDIQAGTIEIRDSRLVIGPEERYRTIFGGTAWHFYHGAKLDRGRPVRIDLIMLYDPTKLVRARKWHPRAKSVRRGLNHFLYKFKDPHHKDAGLRGLVQVLR